MKKVFILIAFLFAVVCYAAPPPDLVPDIVTAQAEFVVQDNKNVAGYTFEAQEVVFSYIYDCFYRKSGYINKLHGWEANKQNTNFGYPFGADY